MANTEATPLGHAVLPQGAVIGRYVVLGLVGRGGMGEVYAAYDPELDRKVAVKLLRGQASGAADPEARARLLREAQAIAKLSHPNVVVVYDVGTFKDGVFIAMEFVDGHTVGYWMQAAERPWRRALEVFLAAGRGLEAAHAAGLVHRDFKPDNVMITRDGQVRVMDFGLARTLDERPDLQSVPTPAPETVSGRLHALMHLGEAAPAPAEPAAPDLDATARLGAPGRAPASAASASGENYLQQKLTLTGAMLGTPAYMAPEQFSSEPVDARTDQFSFCVALYEVLYGHRPFEGDTLVTLMTNVVTGTIRPAPAKTKVPTRLRRVLLRGLEVDPARRYPTMGELLGELARDPRSLPRGWVGALSVVVVACLLFIASNLRSLHGTSMCGGAGEKLAGVWDLGGSSPRRDAIRRTFAAKGKPGLQQLAGVTRVLDDYVARWASMYRDACEATHVRGEQSAEALDLRMTCLGQRLGGVKALTDVLSEAGDGVVENAVSAAGELPSLERCADTEMLRSVIQPPADPKTRARVEALRDEITKVRAMGDAGQCTQALAAGRAALSRAVEVGYLPLKAEASYVVGRAGNFCGDQVAAIAALEEAAWAAETSRHDEVAVDAAAFAAGIYAERIHDLKASRLWLHYADAVLSRLPGHPMLEAYTDVAWGTLLQVEGKDDEALPRQTAALDLKERALGPMHPDTAASVMNVGLALHELGRDAEAAPYAGRAVQTFEALLGADSSQLALALFDQGETLTGLGRLSEARAALERAIGIWTRGGASPFFIAYAKLDLARVAVAQGRAAEARALLEPAIPTLNTQDRLLGAQARFVFAQAVCATPRERKRGLELARAARSELARASAPARKLAEADAWLATHATP